MFPLMLSTITMLTVWKKKIAKIIKTEKKGVKRRSNLSHIQIDAQDKLRKLQVTEITNDCDEKHRFFAKSTKTQF